MWLVIVLISSVFLISYTLHDAYLLYVSRRRKTPDTDIPQLQEWPNITCIIPVANEEKTIKNKIENLWEAYPADRMRIIVVLNNSRDRTGDICRYLDVDVIESSPGKLNALETGRLAAETEYVLATDSDVTINKNTVKRLVSLLAQETKDVCAISAFCGYSFDRPCRLGNFMNAHELKQAKVCQLQGDIASSALVQGTCYVYRKSIFPPYPLDAAEDELAAAMAIVRAGYRAKTDVQAQCRQYSSLHFWPVLSMLARHAGAQIHTCLSNLNIIYTAKIRTYGLFIFPFYLFMPRCLPFVTVLIALIPFLTSINIAVFYLAWLVIYLMVLLVNPFFGLQIAALHLAWCYALIANSKKSTWNSTTRRVPTHV